MNKLLSPFALCLLSTLLLQAWPVLAASPGSTRVVVRVGDVAPGIDGEAVFNNFGNFRFTPDGRNLVYRSVLRGKNITPGNQEALWLGAKVLARTGDAAPGTGGALFQDLDFGRDVAGLAFTGTLTGKDVNAGNNQGVWSGQTLVVRTGAEVPGDALGRTYTGLGSVVGNAAGNTLYIAGLNDNSNGVWLDTTVVAQRNMAAPGVPNAAIFNVYRAALGAQGQVAYTAEIVGSGIGSGNQEGIWSGGRLVARQGDAVPGGRLGSVIFSTLAVGAQGEVAFLAPTLSTASGQARQTLWREKTLIATEGDLVSVGGSTLSRQPTAVLGVSARGEAVYSAGLSGAPTGGSSNSLWREQTVLAHAGQSLAGAGLSQLRTDDVSFMAMATGGQLAFSATLLGAGTSAPDKAHLLSDGIDLLVAARIGDVLPDGRVIAALNGDATFNAVGQLAYSAQTAKGTTLLTYTPELRWRSTTSGSWADAANWTLSLNPADVHDVTLDPSNSLTITGPAGTVAVNSLQVGTGSGIATLAMAGGRIDAASVRIGTQGALSGTGSFGSPVHNQGVLQAERLQISSGLDNAGTVRGATGVGSRLDTNLNNTSAGRVRVGSGETLQLFGQAHQNAGVVEVNGGRLETSGSFTNARAAIVDLKNATVVADGAWRNDAGGRMLLNEARLTTSAGLSNAGQVQITSGSSEFFGAVRNDKGGQIILSGQGTTTFYGNVDAQDGSELRVSGGATAVFFGAVQQRSGAVFSGSGLKYYEGGFSVGNSPGAASDGGDVAFGLGNLYLAELGGTAPGTGHDFYDVAGTLTLGGTLQIVSWDGFTGQAGQSFDLFDWGQLQGAFGAIDSSGLLLAEGTRLDLSRLYLDGTVSVTAVPEPGTWALMLGGVGLLTWRRRHSA